MTKNLYAAIMAGGGGTRLWPLSRKTRPKQTLNLIGDETLFQMAVNRLQPLIPIERTFVLTIEEQAEILQSQIRSLTEDNFILEPGPKGTASVIGLAAIHLKNRDKDAIMACLTADHYIPGVEAFQNLLHAAYEVAREGYLVTLGISPTGADTGYGYIHRGEEVQISARKNSYRVQAFKEKPDAATAKAYLESGDYFWNSGMFIWHVDAILGEIERQLPDLHKCLMKIEASLGTASESSVTAELWPSLQSITVDYGIMEGAREVIMLPADDLGWIDIGDWGRLFDILPHDDVENVVIADAAQLTDSSGVFVYQDKESERLIAGLGLTDLVVIDTGDVLLVCPRSRAAALKEMIEELKDSGKDRYL